MACASAVNEACPASHGHSGEFLPAGGMRRDLYADMYHMEMGYWWHCGKRWMLHKEIQAALVRSPEEGAIQQVERIRLRSSLKFLNLHRRNRYALSITMWVNNLPPQTFYHPCTSCRWSDGLHDPRSS